MRPLIFAAVLAAAFAVTTRTPHGQEAHDVELLVRRTVAYLTEYVERLGSVVAEERYVQSVGRARRSLRSELVFMRDDEFGWVEFRDVQEVDGHAVRNREGRVMDLFAKPHPHRLTQARRIVAEGARYNLNPPDARMNRTINLPLTALRFLRAGDYQRSRFRIAEDRRASNGTVTLDFEERDMPRLIATDDHSASRGRYVVEAETGRVLVSEVRVTTKRVTAFVKVTFERDGRLDLWLPRTMDERYTGASLNITGRAEYSDYRQFRIDTATEIGR